MGYEPLNWELYQITEGARRNTKGTRSISFAGIAPWTTARCSGQSRRKRWNFAAERGVRPLRSTELIKQGFIQAIDCRFPYFDEPEWKRHIELGSTISANSGFMVLHEISRPARSVSISPEHQKALASYWATHFQHPLAERIFNIALRLIDGERLQIGEVLQHFNEIRKFKGQYNALAIVYFTSDELEDIIENQYNAR